VMAQWVKKDILKAVMAWREKALAAQRNEYHRGVGMRMVSRTLCSFVRSQESRVLELWRRHCVENLQRAAVDGHRRVRDSMEASHRAAKAMWNIQQQTNALKILQAVFKRWSDCSILRGLRNWGRGCHESRQLRCEEKHYDQLQRLMHEMKEGRVEHEQAIASLKAAQEAELVDVRERIKKALEGVEEHTQGLQTELQDTMQQRDALQKEINTSEVTVESLNEQAKSLRAELARTQSELESSNAARLQQEEKQGRFTEDHDSWRVERAQLQEKARAAEEARARMEQERSNALLTAQEATHKAQKLQLRLVEVLHQQISTSSPPPDSGHQMGLLPESSSPSYSPSASANGSPTALPSIIPQGNTSFNLPSGPSTSPVASSVVQARLAAIKQAARHRGQSSMDSHIAFETPVSHSLRSLMDDLASLRTP